MGKFYTMGTGRTTEAEFHTRLWDFKMRVSPRGPLCVVDIRREGSKSRNGTWCYQENLCTYKKSALANHDDSTQAGLCRYRDHIVVSRKVFESDIRKAFLWLLQYIRDGDRPTVLLCSCGKAFKPNGKSWNCHRVPLALELLEDLGKGWEVEHL